MNVVKEEDKVKDENYIKEGVDVNDQNYYKHMNNVKDENNIKDMEDVKDEVDVDEEIGEIDAKGKNDLKKELIKRYKSADVSATEQMNPYLKRSTK